VTQFWRSQLANQTDRSSLPDAELNPLLNPLLAQNMGRWAEVYFNAVPERREEAVQELLHQLEAEQARREQSASELDRNVFNVPRFNRSPEAADTSLPGAATKLTPSPNLGLPNQASPTQALSSEKLSNESSAAKVLCSACGHENNPDQRFCGMCGAKLSAATAEEFESARPQEYEFREGEDISRDEYSQDRDPYPRPLRSQYEYEDDDRFRGMFQFEPEPEHSYRNFIAVGVAIIAVVLIFVAWRTGQMTSALMRIKGESPAPVSQQQPAQSRNPATTQNGDAPQSTPPNSSPENNAAGNSASSAAAGTQSQPQASSPAPQAKTEAIDRGTAAPVKSPNAKSPNPETTDSATGDGAQELAIAQGYLNDGNGHQADRAEAAQWLWKAVGKRNLEATLLLSDLYLHGGQGVGKNCDQARILLDAAATRGSKEASVRLRNLQAFDCQ
jgi:hypothetical protein